MRLGKVIALFGLLAMSAVIIYGFVVGDFSAEGAVLIRMPWGIVSLVDLYTGFVLFSCWICFRERSPLVAGAWTVAVMTLGNFTASLYVLVTLFLSRGDWKRFWLGQRA